MNKQAVLLKNHIDKFCGDHPKSYFTEETTNINIAQFENTPNKGLTTYISIGLSAHLLVQASGKKIRQELIITVDSSFTKLKVEDVILSTCKIILEEHKPLMRGETIGPLGLIFPEENKSNLTSIVCCSPAFFDNEFSFFEADELTVFVELILITTKELKMLKDIGWSIFFEKIDGLEIDMLNLFR